MRWRSLCSRPYGVGVLDRANAACALGACRSAVFSVQIPEGGPYDLLATLNITATNSVPGEVAITEGGVRLLAAYGRAPQAAECAHDARGIEMSSADGGKVLVAPLGLCDAEVGQ
jgi:hypothetical protein